MTDQPPDLTAAAARNALSSKYEAPVGPVLGVLEEPTPDGPTSRRALRAADIRVLLPGVVERLEEHDAIRRLLERHTLIEEGQASSSFDAVASLVRLVSLLDGEPWMQRNELLQLLGQVTPGDWKARIADLPLAPGDKRLAEQAPALARDLVLLRVRRDEAAELPTPAEREVLEVLRSLCDDGALHAYGLDPEAPDDAPLDQAVAAMWRERQAEAVGSGEPVIPTHRCLTCGARWRDFGDSWSLVPGDECGPCCDNVPVELVVATGWVDCEQRLPTSGALMLVRRALHEMIPLMGSVASASDPRALARWEGDGWYTEQGDLLERVTAWTNIPAIAEVLP